MPMQMTKRHKWMMMAGVASAVAAPLAERAVAAAWRRAAGEDPPIDVDGRDVNWARALAWTAASAVVVAIAQVVARQGAAVVWEQLTGTRPPPPRHRRKRLPHG
jgi:hypothetical protein